MAERKSCLITVSIEPTLYAMVKENAENMSELIRTLLIHYLLEKELISREQLTEVLV